MTAPPDAGRVLLPLARGAIARRLDLAAPPVDTDAPWVAEPGATFVTLISGGTLRGCIGSLTPERPIGEDVAANARAAAFHDPRFAPVVADELGALRVGVSLLGPAVPLAAGTRDEALDKLRPHVDGVVLRWRSRRATFLPQVWEQLPEPDEFLRRLESKAGLTPGRWDGNVRLSVYGVVSWWEDGAEAHHDHDSASGSVVASHRGRPTAV